MAKEPVFCSCPEASFITSAVAEFALSSTNFIFLLSVRQILLSAGMKKKKKIGLIEFCGKTM